MNSRDSAAEPGAAVAPPTTASKRAAGVSAALGAGSPAHAPEKLGYYGRGMLKPPVWTWEIPVYFFLGGIAGAAAILAFGAILQANQPLSPQPLARNAARLAVAATLLSAGLLIRDLGRPQRFLNMLRVFKPQSPMSVGVWVLGAFGAVVTTLAVVLQWPQRSVLYVGVPTEWGYAVQVALAAVGAVLGAVLATYTGVLLGATVIPAWNTHRRTLPLHFGVAALGSAAAVLELLGHASPALNAVGFAAAASETCIGAWIELHRHGAADRPLREGAPGWMMRLAGVTTGPLSFALRFFGLREWAAVSFLIGALVSRFAWVEAGKASAKDPRSVLARG